jgi:capsular polysaccharide biosynthesis protein
MASVAPGMTGVRRLLPGRDPLRPVEQPDAGRTSGTGLVTLAAVIAFLVFGGVGAAVVKSRTVAYRSDSVLTINQPKLIASSRDAGPIQKLVDLRTQYAELLTTSVVTKPIADQVGMTAAQVASQVTAIAQPNSLLIVVQADAASRSKAIALSRASSTALITYADDSQAQARVPADERVVLAVATPATTAQRLTRSVRTAATVGVFLGAVAAALTALVASVLSRRRP